MNIIHKTIGAIDAFQRRHRLTGFVYAVIKKYADDKVGYQAALLTYYGFLAVFPLLLVLTTVAGIVATTHADIQATIVDSMTDYFPILGSQLSSHIQSIHKSGLALIVGIVFTLYGARGVADVFRHSVKHIWHEPADQAEQFPRNLLKSLIIMVVGGLGLLAASIIAGFAAAAGKGIGFHGLSLLINLVVLFLLFSFLINASLVKRVPAREIWVGCLSGALGLIALQTAGGYLLAHELKGLDALYSNFAIPLGLLFWIYLQAQVVYYAVTAAAVDSNQLWPRSLSGKDLTPADKKLNRT